MKTAVRWGLIILALLLLPFIVANVAILLGVNAESFVSLATNLEQKRINLAPFRWGLLIAVYFYWNEIISVFVKAQTLDKRKQFVLRYMKNYYAIGAVFFESMTFLFNSGGLW